VDLSKMLSSLEPETQAFALDDKNYLLKEPSEAAVGKFVLLRHRARQYEEGKSQDRVSYSEAQLALVGESLYELDADDRPKSDKDGKHLPLGSKKLETWPSRLVTAMFQWCIDHINRDVEESLDDLKKRAAEIQEKIRLKEEGRGNS
jgi:hypothetical protein